MKEIYFKDSIRTPTGVKSSPSGKIREKDPEVSERWKKALERKTPDKSVSPEDTEESGLTSSGNTGQKSSVVQSSESQKKICSPFDLAGIRKETNSVKSFDRFSAKKSEDGKVKSDFQKNEVYAMNLLPSDPSGNVSVTGNLDSAVNAESMISQKTVMEIRQIIEKMAEEISIKMTPGLTETSITLKNASLFNDAVVIVSEYASAPNQINIRFENLNTHAHDLISMQINQETLKLALDKKGYQVHMITAPTEIASAEPVFKGNPGFSGRENNKEDTSDPRHKKNQDS